MTRCGTTHHQGCPCHEARRDAEVERLTGQVDDLAFALDAEQDEVVRLRDGIARHRDATVKAMSQDWELWELLEDHDER